MILYKKNVCLLLSVTLLASMLICGTFSVSADSEVLYSCSFAGAVTEDDPATDAVENKANRTSLSAYDWSKWETNTSIGTFGYDGAIEKNYISLQDGYQGKGAFSISDAAVTSGKIYLSLSYRRLDSVSGYAFIRVVDGNDAIYNFARLKDGLALCESINSLPVASVGDFTDERWHVVGLVFDLDNGTLAAYADGDVADKVMELPADMNGIRYMGISLNSTAYSGDVTDILVKKETGTSTVTAEGRLDGNNIHGSFNEPIGSVIGIDDVSLELCGAAETLPVTGIKYSGTNITVEFDGEPLGGREYRVRFDGRCKTLFGSDIPPVYVSVPAAPEIVTISPCEGESAVNADGVIDFENLTYTDTSPNAVTAPEDFYTYIANHNKAGKVVQVNTLTKQDGTPLSSGSGNDSDYAFRPWGWAGLSLGKEKPEGFSGVAVYEFDYYFPSVTNSTVYFGLMDSSNARKKLAKMPLQATAWTHFKMEYNFGSQKAAVYIGGALFGEYSKLSDGSTLIPDNITRMALAFDSDIKYADIFVDNFTQSFIEYKPSVEAVRYVDVDNVKSGLDLISSATKAIEIKFSEDMDETTLDAVSLSDSSVITDTYYDSNTHTYTIELGNLLRPEQYYELVIPATVASAGGAAVSETVYGFTTDVGIFEVSGLRLESGGQEITDVSLLAGADVRICVDTINTIGDDSDIVLIYCLYDDDALVDINYAALSLVSGMQTLSTPLFTVRDGITPDSAKVFVRKGGMADYEALLPATEY